MSRHQDDLEREIQAHLDLETEEQMEAGLAADQARSAARRAFGNVTLLRETISETWGWPAFDRLVRDFRHALRSLRKSPGFAAAAILILGLSIGAATAIFSFADRMLLRALPVKDPGRLVRLEPRGSFIGGNVRGGDKTFSYPKFVDLQASNMGVFVGIAARQTELVDVAWRGPAERVLAELVSGNYFAVLGVSAAVGRTLTPEDDRVPDAEPYVVLAYDCWKRRFAGDPSVLNRAFDLNGHPMTVVGVAQRGFRGEEPMQPVDLFVPMAMKRAVTPTWDDMRRRDSIWLNIFARLQPGVAAAEAASAMAAPYHAALRSDLAANPRDESFSKEYLAGSLAVLNASHGGGDTFREFAEPAGLLTIMAGVLLLIACVNLANLLLSRAAARRREIAVRLSLGISRGRLVRLMLIESLALALAGGALGLLLSIWLTPLLVSLFPVASSGALIQALPDWRIARFTAALSMLSALLAGLAPALHASRPDLAAALKSESAALAGGKQARLRRLLVALEVMLSMLLLAGAGLFARSFYRLFAVDSGMATTHLLQFSIDPSLHHYTPARLRQLLLDVQSDLARLPGAVCAAAASSAVLSGGGWVSTLHVEAHQPGADEDMLAGWNQVLPGFFSTMGVPLVAGREFTPRDLGDRRRVAIVNETYAKRFYPQGDVLGRHLGLGPTAPLSIEIVGVVRDFKAGDLKDKPSPYTFTAALESPDLSEMTFYIRSRQDPRALAEAARRVVAHYDPALPVVDIRTAADQIEQTDYRDRLFAFLSVAFACLATLLAAIGLYGVTSYAVARRTQELGVRLALGAGRGTILRLVLREVLWLAAVGIALGLPLALALGRLVESELFGVRGSDPAVMLGAALVIAVVSALAGYLPARRATRIDPLRALRYE
jgi:predicted permease